MEPIIFRYPPAIPKNMSGVLDYKLQLKDYKLRVKAFSWISGELLAIILALGLIWINVEWVRVTATVLSILIALIILVMLGRVF